LTVKRAAHRPQLVTGGGVILKITFCVVSDNILCVLLAAPDLFQYISDVLH